MRKKIVYNESAVLRFYSRIQGLFTKEFMEARKGLGDPSPKAVFIVGMPRCGSTLVEQILDSHHQIFGAGELMQLGRLADQLGTLVTTTPRGPVPLPSVIPSFPEVAQFLTSENFQSLGESYLRMLQDIDPAVRLAERVVDKGLANIRYVGLIHLIMPNARIIHVHRDPIDTCLSAFSKLFKDQCLYTYDLGELGRHYQAYQRIMEHWNKILPPSVMLEVEYEELINNFEVQAKRIVAHVGLEWDPACLDFHQNRRKVHTASAAQVRQPIYRTSIGRWRPPKEVLEPLLKGLNDIK